MSTQAIVDVRIVPKTKAQRFDFTAPAGAFFPPVKSKISPLPSLHFGRNGGHR